ncbi:MAG: histidine kinase [Prevotellaceae bacterium]|jgi:signal transduction histidine kinase|nr:histidine kinase [Prevotellaceae bacterium]
MKKSFVLAVTLTLLYLLAGRQPLNASEKQSAYNVLLIQSYDTRTPWHNELTAGLRYGLEANGIHANITVEYLNAAYWNYSEEQLIMRRICDRARQRETDVIVTAGDEAFYTLMHCGDSLPHQLPVVITGIKFTASNRLDYPNVCGYTTRIDFLQLLENAQRIFPRRTEIVALRDNSQTSKLGIAELDSAFQNFKIHHPEYKLHVLNVEGDDAMRAVASICYPQNAYNRIAIAPKWTNFMSFVGKNSKAPVFAGQNEALTNGVFCVHDVTPVVETQRAADLAAQILRGVHPSTYGVRDYPGQMIYDYKQLEYFNIPQELVRNGTVLNVPVAVRYRVLVILGYIVTAGLLILLVIWLNTMRRREVRRRTYAQTRLLIQNRLVEQRNEFDNIFNSIRDGLVTYDVDFRIHFINHSMASMVQMDKEAVEARNYEGKAAGTVFRLYVSGENVMHKLLKEARDTKRIVPFPENAFMLVVGNGNYFPVSGEAVPIYSGNKLTGVAVCCRNISDEEMNKRFFNLAIEFSSVFPWSYSMQSNLFTMAGKFLDYFDVKEEDKDDFTLDKLMALVHPDDIEGMRGFMNVCKGELSDANGVARFRNGLGKFEWVTYHCVAYKGFDANEPYMLLGVCQSIQKYKDTEAELTAARDRALQADKLKSAFLANMSHEIRTPLNSIVGFSDLLRDIDSFSHEEVKQFIDTININCTLLLALISDILDLARIEAGSMDFHFADINLSFIMQQIYDSQRFTMPEGVELLIDLPEGDGKSIQTDVVRLKQVINNFINNAKKFTSKGYIKIGYTTERSGWTTFFVEDTGLGISEENQKRIFERFYKVDSFTQGAGLGLSICQTIVERFNGKMEVSSELGKGTRFIIRIPDIHIEAEVPIPSTTF